MKKSKNQRKVYHVVPDGNEWHVVFEAFEHFIKKEDAIDHAIDLAKELHSLGGLSQVKIHGKDGKIQKEYTYGKDPKRHKG